MEIKGSRRRTTGSNINRICMLIGCLFALLILGLVSATLHYVIPVWNNTSDSSPFPLDSADTSKQFLRNLPLPTRFPGYFRSPEEQKLVQEMLPNSSFIAAPNGSVERLVNACSGTCHKPAEWIQVLAGPIYHACCNSTSYFEYPTWMIDISGKNRTLATFEGNVQYFYAEQCKQMNGCKSCQCQIQTTYVTAVVKKDDKTGYEIAWFKRPGCCKCMNGQL